MENYDVIIVGAGPAGGQCARDLAKAGAKVLLAERNKDFSVNSYSSAGAPLEIMSLFQLPEKVVGSYWNSIAIHSSHDAVKWQSTDNNGVIMDYAKLRSFLAEDAKNHGADFTLGLAYQSHQQQNGTITASFKEHNSKQIKKFQTKILVDATGVERQVLAKNLHIDITSHSFPSTGIEYLVEVPDTIYKKYANELSFFMGKEWMPQGYSWIFPMEKNRLKIGVGRYFQNEHCVPYENSYTHYLENMMQNCLGSTSYPILDKHGKTIIYSYKRLDPHYNGNVIAIGDSVSTINPLALEGIRHAMICGQIAAKHIQKKLNGSENSFECYAKEVNCHYNFKWILCEFLMKIIYREPKDKNIDKIIQAFQGLSLHELMNLAFHYKLLPAIKFLARYLYLKIVKI